MNPMAGPPYSLSGVPDPCTELTFRIVSPSSLNQSPGPLRCTCSTGTLRGSKNTENISNGVTILAPVLRAISSVEPTTSVWPSATTTTSTFGKSATLTGLSGLVTNGFVRTTLPVGDVNRKMDHESHSILTGPVWATP